MQKPVLGTDADSNAVIKQKHLLAHLAVPIAEIDLMALEPRQLKRVRDERGSRAIRSSKIGAGDSLAN